MLCRYVEKYCQLINKFGFRFLNFPPLATIELVKKFNLGNFPLEISPLALLKLINRLRSILQNSDADWLARDNPQLFSPRLSVKSPLLHVKSPLLHVFVMPKNLKFDVVGPRLTGKLSGR